MPPSCGCGRGTKRKVAAPEPKPAPVNNLDTEAEEEEEGEGAGSDPNGNEEASSSSAKAKKARVDTSAVHKEYIQTFKLVAKGKNKKKEEKVWSSACRHCDHVVPNKKPGHLESHLYYKHRDVYDMVEALNDERRDELLKKKLPKSTRLDEIVDSYVDWLIDSGQTLHTSDSIAFKNFVHKIDPTIEIPGRWAITTRIEQKYNIMKKMMEEFLKDSI